MNQWIQFDPDTTWTTPKIGELPSWKNAKRVAIDTETRDPQLKKMGPGVRRDAYIVGVSFAIEDGPAAYLPIQHHGGGNLPGEKVFAYLKRQAKTFRGDIVGANLQYDLDFLAEVGVLFSPRFFRDVLTTEALIDELQDSYSLDAVLGRHGIPGKAEEHLKKIAANWGVDPKAGLWQLPARHVGEYAEGDATKPLILLRRQERIIEEQELQEVYDMESRLLPVLLKMRRRGVRVDFDQLERVEKKTIKEEGKALRKLSKMTGVTLTMSDTTKPRALDAALKKIDVILPRTATGEPSVANEVLNALDHPAISLIKEARKLNKLRTSFVSSIREHAIKDRIHCTFNQTRRQKAETSEGEGARYGRLSCTKPNLQNQPSRDPVFGPIWRAIYVPDGRGKWARLDYSQQEPRWLVHFAALVGCKGADKALEQYQNDPKTDIHQMMADLAETPRKDAKEILLGSCYGMGGAKLCKKLGLPTKWVRSRRQQKMIEVAGDEGQVIIDKFNKRAPFVKALSKEAEDRAKYRGYIKTISGRHCRFPRNQAGKVLWTYRAMNRLIQGSAGDQTKQAMIDADAAGIRLQLQVHDELCLTIWSIKEARKLKKVMVNCVPCSVPHMVEIEVGKSWGEVKKI